MCSAEIMLQPPAVHRQDVRTMPRRIKKPAGLDLRMRFRIFCGEDIALGLGKVQLLKLVRETGSVRQAAAQMEMSYMRAWVLVRTMNQCFKKPLVNLARGGSQRGGAHLTPTGEIVLKLYERVERESLKATETTRRQLTALIKSGQSVS